MCQAGKVAPGPWQELSFLESVEDLGVEWAHLHTHGAAAVTASPCLWLGTQENASGAKSRKAKHTSPLGLPGVGAVWAGAGLE